MIKKLVIASLVLISAVYTSAYAYDFQAPLVIQKRNSDYNRDYPRQNNYSKTKDEVEVDQRFVGEQNAPNGDKQIVAAVERRRRVDYIQGSGMVVVKLLPDDNSGLRHQKWMVRLSSGATMQAVYNSDMENCERVPLKVGDVVSMGGQFVYTNEGPMLHWLHYDPRRSRPDGFVEVGGQFYCKEGPRR